MEKDLEYEEELRKVAEKYDNPDERTKELFKVVHKKLREDFEKEQAKIDALTEKDLLLELLNKVDALDQKLDCVINDIEDLNYRIDEMDD